VVAHDGFSEFVKIGRQLGETERVGAPAIPVQTRAIRPFYPSPRRHQSVVAFAGRLEPVDGLDGRDGGVESNAVTGASTSCRSSSRCPRWAHKSARWLAELSVPSPPMTMSASSW